MLMAVQHTMKKSKVMRTNNARTAERQCIIEIARSICRVLVTYGRGRVNEGLITPHISFRTIPLVKYKAHNDEVLRDVH